MTTTSPMVALLVAAAFAGCLAGTSNEGQLPDETPDDDSSGSQTRSGSRGPGNGQGQGDNKSYDAYLEASPDNGTAPLNVTLTFGATWQDHGQRTGQGGNGTGGTSGNQTSSGSASNGTGNQTGNQTSGPGDSGAGNGNDGSHPVNGGHDVTWTLEVRLMPGTDAGNATDDGAADGNATGNQTSDGNRTSSSSSATQTSTGTGTNGTGNGTSSQTDSTTDGADGGSTGDGPSANGTLIVSFNGTSDDLPGNETVLLNETGSYQVTFTVTPDDGSPAMVRQANVSVEPLPPGSPLGNETITFEGSFLASEPLLCIGSEDFEWVLNSTFAGAPADVAQLNVTAEAGGLNDFQLTLFAPNETEVASGEAINVEGPFENGTYVLRAESCVAADVDYTITAVAHYATPGYVPKGTGDEAP